MHPVRTATLPEVHSDMASRSCNADAVWSDASRGNVVQHLNDVCNDAAVCLVAYGSAVDRFDDRRQATSHWLAMGTSEAGGSQEAHSQAFCFTIVRALYGYRPTHDSRVVGQRTFACAHNIMRNTATRDERVGVTRTLSTSKIYCTQQTSITRAVVDRTSLSSSSRRKAPRRQHTETKGLSTAPAVAACIWSCVSIPYSSLDELRRLRLIERSWRKRSRE